MAIAKPAENRHPIHELLRRRWSPVAFSERPVEMDKLQSLLEAWRWAPSSFNEQPWALVVATRAEAADFEKALGCLTEGNQKWARSAPVLLLTFAKAAFERNGKPNRHAWHDVGLAAMSLSVQATQLGLFAHQMAGIVPERIREAYGVPAGWEPATAIAVGYLGDLNLLAPELRDREMADRRRKGFAEFVFAGRWGEAAAL
jgi:nitroreductase